MEAPPSRELAELLMALPRRPLGPGGRERFQEDGILLVEGLLASEPALERLRQAAVPTAYADNVLPVNGNLLSLSRDSPLGPAISELLGGRPLRIWSGQFFNKEFWPQCAEVPDSPFPGACDTPHLDLDAEATELLPFVSAWVALSDANHSLGFIQGSHTAKHPCGYSDTVSDWACLGELARNLTRQRGRESLASFSMKAGDVVFFYNQVFHYTRADVATPKRIGASLRYVAADHGFQGPIVETNDIIYWYSHTPRECSSLGDGVLFPLAHAPEEAGQWPKGWPVKPLHDDLRNFPSRAWKRETTDTFRRCPGYS